MTTERQPNEQALINDKILSSLHDILGQNRQIIQKIDEQNSRIDHLEHAVTKKAIVYGAIAGTASSGVFTVAMEIVRAKFGG